MSTTTEAKAKKPHVLTENQKKVLRVLYPGAPRTKDHFLEVGVTQWIKGVRALVARGMVYANNMDAYWITASGTAAIEEADGIKRHPESIAADTQVIELAPVTHPLLDFSGPGDPAFVAFNAPAEKGVSESLPAPDEEDCAPGDPTRRVGVWQFREEMGLPPETKWVATVDLVHGRGDTVHTTAGFDTEGEAKREAIAWAEANKYEVV
jgi:hypothetical protein